MDAETISSLLTAIRDAVAKPTTNDDDIALPVFDPDKNDCGAISWCNSVDALAKDLKWSSIRTAAKAGKALRGSATTWFESWEPSEGRSWENFKTDILDAYPEKKNLAEKLTKAVLYTSDSCESYSEYFREKLRLLRNTKISFTDPQLIELICGGINDVSVRMASLNSGVTTTSGLVVLLSTYIKTKKRCLENNDESLNGAGPSGVKRARFNIEKKCYICNQSGHLHSQCFKKQPQQSQQFKQQTTPPVSKPNNYQQKVCTYCKKLGHTESVCYHKQRAESSSLVTVSAKGSNFLGKPN